MKKIIAIILLIAFPLCLVVWAGLDAAGGDVINCGDVLPNTNGLYDLGSISLRWKESFFDDVLMTGDLTFDGGQIISIPTLVFAVTTAEIEGDLVVHDDILPKFDNISSIGTSLFRFKTIWTSENAHLGTSSFNFRVDAKAGGDVGTVDANAVLDDLTAGGTFNTTLTADIDYKVEIDGTGTPDTFKWSDDGGSTYDATTVAITGSAQTLNNGITATFAATTGHTSGDYWTWTVTVHNPMWLQDAAGTGIMYVGNDGKVGINTITPATILDVNGTATITNCAVLGSDSAVFQPNADATTFFQVLDADGGTPVLNVDSTNERVGIGTATPAEKLDVAGRIKVDRVIGRADNDLWLQGNFLIFRNLAGSTEYMRITATGKVGIGELSPQDKLEVNGTVLVKDKLKFTQDDGLEYIDSLNDGYMDYGATTGHRFYNNIELHNRAEARFYNNGSYVGFEAPISLSADQIWVLPTADGDAGAVLTTDGSGTLSWTDNASEKTWAFMSRDASSGINYVGGFYKFGSADNDFNPLITFGTANVSYAAHFFLVQAAGGGGGTDTVVRVTGTSINDQGDRSAADTEDLTVSEDSGGDDYYETTKKWLGQITIEKQSGPDLLCNYGFCKYWDNNNTAFKVVGIEATWLGAKNDATPDIKLRHHQGEGWTYNAAATPTPPTELASMATDHNTEIQIAVAEEGSWKRDNLSTDIDGNQSEGTIIELTTTTNRTYAIGNFLIRITPQ